MSAVAIRKYFAFIAFAAAAVAASVTVPAATFAQPADFAAKADAILHAAYPADGPGAAVIVTRGGRTIYEQGRGFADLETRRPITPDTVFRLGSITKQFTAAVILQLVTEKRISLDDPVSRFFADYPQPGARATIRQLLNHTSGIQSYTEIPDLMNDARSNRAHSTAEMIALFRDVPPPSQPGQAWVYNNSGYVLLGAIIESVTGRSWHEAVAQRITRPLALRTIAYGVTGESGLAMARGYTVREGRPVPAGSIHLSTAHAAGALIGSVRDLARWSHALHHGRVVSPALYRQMIQPTSLAGGTNHPYGFGIVPGDLRGQPTIQHAGGIFGFITDAAYLPSQDIFIAVFANSDRPATPPGTVLRRLGALWLGDPFPEFTRVQADPATIEPLLGVYRIGEGPGTRRFYARDGKFYMRRDEGSEQEVFAAGQDRFFYGPNNLTWFRVERAADGAHVMQMHPQGANQPERAVRTGPVPAEAP